MKKNVLAWTESEQNIIDNIINILKKFFLEKRLSIPEDIQIFPPREKGYFNILITTGTIRNGKKPGFLFMRKELEKHLQFKIGKFDITAGKIVVNLSQLLNPKYDKTEDLDKTRRRKIKLGSVKKNRSKSMVQNLDLIGVEAIQETPEFSIPSSYLDMQEDKTEIEVLNKEIAPEKTNTFLEYLRKYISNIKSSTNTKRKIESYDNLKDIAVVLTYGDKIYANNVLNALANDKKDYGYFLWMKDENILVTKKKSLLKAIEGYVEGMKIAYKISEFILEVKMFMSSNKILGGLQTHPIFIAHSKFREKLVIELSNTNFEEKNRLLLVFLKKKRVIVTREENKIMLSMKWKV